MPLFFNTPPAARMSSLVLFLKTYLYLNYACLLLRYYKVAINTHLFFVIKFKRIYSRLQGSNKTLLIYYSRIIRNNIVLPNSKSRLDISNYKHPLVVILISIK